MKKWFLDLLINKNAPIASVKELLHLKYGFQNRRESNDPTILKSSWKQGEWQSEADEIVWVEKTSFGEVPCRIIRNAAGCLCGYVCIPSGHPYVRNEKEDDLGNIKCHGGVTYTSRENDFLIIGFDCAHFGDITPKMNNFKVGIYRNVSYVLNQILNIIEQLSDTI